MRILVTFAVEAEFVPWRARHAFRLMEVRTPMDGASQYFYRGLAHGNEVDVLLTGVGWRESKPAGRPQFLLSELLKRKPDVFLSSGFAGALAPDLQVGDIVAANSLSVRTAEPLIGSNSQLLRLAEVAGARVKKMQLTETHVVSEPSVKKFLTALADFVDMEGYHVLQIASAAGIPVISVRVISDSYKDRLPFGIEKVVDHEGRIQILPLLRFLLRRPWQIPSLIEFGSKSRAASVALADFLDRFLKAINDIRCAARANRETVAI